MRGDLILHFVHISGKGINEERIDELLMGNSLGGITRGLNPLQCVTIYQGAAKRSTEVEPWLMSWRGKILTMMILSDWSK